MELYAGQSNKNGARPPLAVLNYTLDKACLSYRGEHCSPIDLCQHATHGSQTSCKVSCANTAVVLL